jgi:membrane protease YdiL (CAAX protease family)
MSFLPGRPPEPSSSAASSHHDGAPDPSIGIPRKSRLHTGIIVAALFVLMACILYRTIKLVESPDARAVSERTTKIFDALQATKSAVSARDSAAFIFDTSPPLRASEKRGASRTSLPSSARNSSALEDSAIEKWRALTWSKTARRSDWRRLGITLYLFGRQGGQEALQQAVQHRDPPDPSPAGKTKSLLSTQARIIRAVQDDKTNRVTPAEEKALWQAIYGTAPLNPQRAPALRTTLTRLNLGWFEKVVLARLYARVGLRVQAEQAANSAYDSARAITKIAVWHLRIFLIGITCLLMAGLRIVGQHLQKPQTFSPSGPDAPWNSTLNPIPVPYDAVTSAPYANTGMSAVPIVPPLPISATRSEPAPPLSYRTRIAAFVVYMALFVFIGLPFRLLLSKLGPHLEDWSNTALLRLNVVINLVLYIPIVLISLWALQRLVIAEAPEKPHPSLRSLLADLGLRSQRPLADTGVGILGYVMVTPLFLFATVLSNWLFRHYHTPVNPVQLETMMTHNLFDRLLLLLEAAVAAPIIEELMFRGLLFPALRTRWGTVGGVALSAAVFALFHPTLPGGFLPIWTLGAAFAIAYRTRDSLFPNIVMHGLHNGYILLTAFVLFGN